MGNSVRVFGKEGASGHDHSVGAFWVDLVKNGEEEVVFEEFNEGCGEIANGTIPRVSMVAIGNVGGEVEALDMAAFDSSSRNFYPQTRERTQK